MIVDIFKMLGESVYFGRIKEFHYKDGFLVIDNKLSFDLKDEYFVNAIRTYLSNLEHEHNCNNQKLTGGYQPTLSSSIIHKPPREE